MSDLIDIHTHHFDENNTHRQIQIITDFIHPSPKHLFCYGLHPWLIDQQDKKVLQREIKRHSSSPEFFALGEIGLDKSCTTDFKLQVEYFNTQIDMALELNINKIILHCVKSHQEIYYYLKEKKYLGTILLHDYQKNHEIFQQFSKEWRTYISLGLKGINRHNALKRLENIPIRYIFFETDSDEKTHIRDVYQAYANLLNLSFDELVKQVSDNFQKWHN